MKRTLSLMLALVMVLGIFTCVPVYASNTNRLLFSLNSDGQSYRVDGCDEYWSSEIVIPSTYCDKPVTTIRDYAFVDCPYFSSVSIPDSVVSIGVGSFSNCTELETVSMGNGVKNIGDNAFSGCLKLVSVSGGINIESFGDYAFDGCKSLTSFVISDKVTTISKYLFSDCMNLQSVSIGNGVTLIDEYAFSGCIKLTDIIFGNNLERIGEYAFRRCENLTSLVFPDGLITIGDFSFVNCDSLINIEIPQSVETIGENALTYCFYLQSIKVDEDNANYSSVDGVLFDKDKTTLIRYAAGREDTSYIVPDSVSTIGDCAFYGSLNLTSAIIPDSVTYIGETAFYFCSELKSITIPNSVTAMGGGVFGQCYKLESFVMPDSVTSFGDFMFQDCINLADVTLSESIKAIPHNSFRHCASLTTVKIPDSVESIDESAFSQCSNLVNIEIPDNVKTIGSDVFSFCTKLSSVSIGNGVTSIGNNAFFYCNNIKEVIYAGSKADWNKISIGTGNEAINNRIFYEIPSKPVTPKTETENALTGVLVKWNAVEDAVKYVVYRRQGGNSTWVNVGTTTGTSLTDTRVISGTYYCYSVRAYNSLGQYSDFIQTNTSTRKFMATPKLTTIYNHTNGLAIKWNAVSGVTKGYRVYRRGAGSTYWTYLGTTKNLYFIDNAVKNRSGEYFRYTVIADGGYHSKFDTTGLYFKRLANPTLTSAVSSSAGITVKWGTVKGTTGYYVYRKTANSSWVRIAAVGGTNNTAYLDKTARKGVTYTYTVRAVYGATTSAYNSGISCCDKY